MIPPLLNDFISLQKDTALLSIAGIAEALQVATLLGVAQLFNLSPVIVAAILFILITIPQARFVDYLIERDADGEREAADGLPRDRRRPQVVRPQRGAQGRLARTSSGTRSSA